VPRPENPEKPRLPVPCRAIRAWNLQVLCGHGRRGWQGDPGQERGRPREEHGRVRGALAGDAGRGVREERGPGTCRSPGRRAGVLTGRPPAPCGRRLWPGPTGGHAPASATGLAPAWPRPPVRPPNLPKGREHEQSLAPCPGRPLRPGLAEVPQLVRADRGSERPGDGLGLAGARGCPRFPGRESARRPIRPRPRRCPSESSGSQLDAGGSATRDDAHFRCLLRVRADQRCRLPRGEAPCDSPPRRHAPWPS